jgi:hypothetical protein
MPEIMQVSRDQALAFRLSGHNLSDRRSVDSLDEVAGACGVRNTPPGSAALGLLARLEGLTPEDVDRALEPRGALVEVLSVRASPLLVPRRDVGIFTMGALPRTDTSLDSALVNHKPSLEEAHISASEALDLAVAAAPQALAGGGLTRGELSAAVTKELPKPLRAWCPGCKANHVPEMLFRLIGVHGEYVITREGKASTYIRSDKLLGKSQKANPLKARAELLRRYLRCFGPTTAADFGAWVGVAASEAQEDWDRLGESLREVDLGGRAAWVHSDDAKALRHPPSAAGTRLLPPYDAYLDQRDRATLIPEKTLHRRVWRALGNPGAVLSGGEVVGTWRTQKKGKRLIITAEAFDEFSKRARDEISAEAERIGPFRECATVETLFAT